MASASASITNQISAMHARILEQLVGETAEPDRVLEAARAVAERSLPSLRDALDAEFGNGLEIEIADLAVTRFAEVKPSEDSFAAMTVASSDSSPDALVLVADAALTALLIGRLFGADLDDPVMPITRAPTPTELDVVTLAFERFGDVVNGSGERSMGVHFPLPAPLAGKELEKRVLRDGPAVTMVFRIVQPGGSGRISITMPQRVLLKHRANDGEGEAATAWRDRFGEEIMRSSVNLVATLDLDRMTLAELATLMPGQVIAMPKGAQSATRLSARGKPLFQCEFGKLGQNYTVRVSEQFDAGKEFIDGLLPG